MAIIEITRVGMRHVEPQLLEGCFIDGPKPGHRLSGHRVEIVGWVLGRSCPAVSVELLAAGAVVGRSNVGVDRPDVAAAFPGKPIAHSAGFAVSALAVGMAPLDLEIAVVLRDGTRVTLATVQAERRWAAGDSRIGAPLVSVIIPCYDRSHFLADAIESVLSQTYPHFEIVVVDDGSHDNAAAVTARFPGVRYVRQKTTGVSGARNRGLRHSRGSCVVFLDADDRLLPEALEVGLTELAADPACAFVSGQCRRIAFGGAPLPNRIAPVISSNHYSKLLQDCFVFTPAAMYRRIVFSTVGGFDTSLATSEDHDLYLRIARAYRIRCHDRVVAEYRRHSTNLTRDPGTNLRNRVGILRAQRLHVFRRGWSHYAAYRQGLAFSRRHYGDPLVNDVVSDLWGGRWRRALKGFRVLLACHPRGAASVATWLLRSGMPSRARTPVGNWTGSD